MSMQSKAVLFTGPRQVSLDTVTLPDPGPNDIVVRTVYSGISTGTEGWLLTGRYWNIEYPTIPGYQKVGVVEQVGSEVDNYAVGNVVFLRTTRLADGPAAHWGGHTAYSVMDANDTYMFTLPDGLDPQEASLLVLPAVGYHGAAEVMPIERGETVCVLGLGMIGQYSAQTAHARGANVLAMDLIESRRRLAAEYAGAEVLDPTEQNVPEFIKSRWPDGIDAVIDTTAHAGIINESFTWLRKGGRYCFQAYYPDTTALDLLWPHINELVMYNPTDSTPAGALQCGRHLADGTFHMRSMITHVEPAANAASLYQMLLDSPREAMGVVLDWQKE